ncbi:phosphoenolpyruvate--protein phosphotransferase [Agarilytica rhodophyticola]|uniref:phosphoenolpyruvate--protein phosphotransferase n=1 Tax=Agarilytica rhodophyticola TaxID=1737490 RepID=UPI000B348EBC|nr:phosphoenolpyruvate--protein phosphotransferase [Agarilytica rhodophyticola]
MSISSLVLKAPLSGPLMPLEHVPDPVFAQKMVGDGISIDPVSECLVAPCDGKIIQLHRAFHAITIEADNGLEIMIHIGIDTVSLEGAGFSPKVAVGDQVCCGDPLIEFDADFIATKAKSLLTQIIVLNSDKVTEFQYQSGFATSTQDPVLMLSCESSQETREHHHHETVRSDDIAVPNPTGLHARPTAVLVAEAKKFDAVIHLYKGGDQANAKSLVSIMSLEVNCGDHVNLTAAGSDAQRAIETLAPLIAGGLGESCPEISAPEKQEAQASQEQDEDIPLSTDPKVILGVSASPGLAIGKIFQLKRDEINVEEHADNIDQQLTVLQDALKNASKQLQHLQTKVEDEEKAAIFEAHQALLDDPELLDNTKNMIADGKSAAFAWKTAYQLQASLLAKLKNELLAARANDLRDVGRRVLQSILGLDADDTEVPDNTILVAQDLTPSDTANLDRKKVLGFCTMTGGASSHVAILARSMNIPAVAGIEARALQIENGTPVILDAGRAVLKVAPPEEEIERVRQAQNIASIKQQQDLSNAHLAATTADGHNLEIAANIGDLKDAQESVRLGGEGVGLLRSEFLFMNRASAPSEEEQFEVYRDVAKVLRDHQRLIIRTLDVGGDKPLPYLPIDAEENPFLGLRGIRVMLHKTSVFRTQLRAILRASEFGNVHIMFPMVTTIEDLRAAKKIVEEEREKLGVKAVPVGIMVEVPTTAILAEQFAPEVDFFSIGTNDLTQYTLAIDRGHPTLAAQADGLNPAVLKLIGNTIAGAHKHNKWAGVCGGIASDPAAVPILLGMGIDELSVSVPSIPSIKAQIRELTLEDCKTLASQALQQNSAAAVRELTDNN